MLTFWNLPLAPLSQGWCCLSSLGCRLVVICTFPGLTNISNSLVSGHGRALSVWYHLYLSPSRWSLTTYYNHWEEAGLRICPSSKMLADDACPFSLSYWPNWPRVTARKLGNAVFDMHGCLKAERTWVERSRITDVCLRVCVSGAGNWQIINVTNNKMIIC